MNKVALVTGASSGLGREFAIQLAAKGFSVAITGRRKERLAEVADFIRKKYSVEVWTYVLDLSLASSPEQLMKGVFTSAKRVDFLVNNAGSSLFGDFLASNLTDHQRLVSLNVNSVMALSHLCATQMKSLNSKCYILNIGSIAANFGVPGIGTYSATKSFVETFSQALSLELRTTNIKVIYVSLGGVDTDLYETAGVALPDSKRKKLMSPSLAVRAALSRIESGETSIVVGLSNKIKTVLFKVLPVPVLARLLTK